MARAGPQIFYRPNFLPDIPKWISIFCSWHIFNIWRVLRIFSAQAHYSGYSSGIIAYEKQDYDPQKQEEYVTADDLVRVNVEVIDPAPKYTPTSEYVLYGIAIVGGIALISVGCYFGAAALAGLITTIGSTAAEAIAAASASASIVPLSSILYNMRLA